LVIPLIFLIPLYLLDKETLVAIP